MVYITRYIKVFDDKLQLDATYGKHASSSTNYTKNYKLYDFPCTSKREAYRLCLDMMLDKTLSVRRLNRTTSNFLYGYLKAIELSGYKKVDLYVMKKYKQDEYYKVLDSMLDNFIKYKEEKCNVKCYMQNGDRVITYFSYMNRSDMYSWRGVKNYYNKKVLSKNDILITEYKRLYYLRDRCGLHDWEIIRYKDSECRDKDSVNRHFLV